MHSLSSLYVTNHHYSRCIGFGNLWRDCASNSLDNTVYQHSESKAASTNTISTPSSSLAPTCTTADNTIIPTAA
ncbi:hypothetical protein M405DRAFT_813419, partial [Rhizopogon salebrosus TDB-379]